MRTLIIAIAIIAGAYALLVVLLYWFQARLVFYPQIGRELVATPAAIGLRHEEVSIQSADGNALHAWYVPADAARGVVLFVHGNAGNVSHRLDAFGVFNEAGLSTLIFDYRGYGKSTGTPSERNTYEDAQAAWDYLTGVRGIPPQRIVIIGESLGGAIAAWLAARVDAGALVLTCTFTSLPELAGSLYPLFPSKVLSRFDYDTRGSLASVHSPVLVAHAPDDSIVPYAHGLELFEAAHAPKLFLELTGSHGDAFRLNRARWVRTLDQFLDQYLIAASPPQPQPESAGDSIQIK
ncbi:MAG: alpha/beta hydrolase [Burkholderiales bacterium]|nr:alpha/beta hydrolase [Burkholderiales bacterium]MDQ3195904.1 alpha/beta hydrolase [Pseudomonadota bacterium]